MFNAILINSQGAEPTPQLVALDDTALPEGEVIVDVEYSTLNYKDALAITGAAPIIKEFPMIAGIDLAGRVSDSRDPRFKAGDPVVATGNGLGENHWGGLSQRAALPGDWLIPLPNSLTTRQAMAIGTAGFTAMLSVMALTTQGVTEGEVLVTGAAGGVGSVAITLLAQRGYHVVASTGRRSEEGYLRALGACDVIDRTELEKAPELLGPERWHAAIDTVGGTTLANVCGSTRYGGTVAACGMAGGLELPAYVLPFIMRSINLVGIDSVYAHRDQRLLAWQNLADELRPDVLNTITTTVPLNAAIRAAGDLLNGAVRGRLVIDTNADRIDV